MPPFRHLEHVVPIGFWSWECHRPTPTTTRPSRFIAPMPSCKLPAQGCCACCAAGIGSLVCRDFDQFWDEIIGKKHGQNGQKAELRIFFSPRLAQRNRRRVIFLGGAESLLHAIQNFPDDHEVRLKGRWESPVASS